MSQNISTKENFIKKEFLDKLRNISTETPAQWGKMNALQMIEHLIEYTNHANGIMKVKVLTPEEKLPAFKNFLRSDKEFRPNTPNSEMPEIPNPPKYSNIEDAINDLEISMYKFFERFSGRENETENHLFFGALNYEEWLIMMYKHYTHHLKQFGLM